MKIDIQKNMAIRVVSKEMFSILDNVKAELYGTHLVESLPVKQSILDFTYRNLCG